MMLRSAAASVAGSTLRLLRVGCGSIFVLSSGAGPLQAQAAPPPSDFQSRIEEVAREHGKEPGLKRLSFDKRLALVEFVFGNMLFAAGHELGHGVIRELELPVLGREEDAADSFAVYAALQVGTEFSHRVLVEAVKGWFLSDKRDKKLGEGVAYYDEHGMNLQRAYQIVCFMVGSDPVKYKDLADAIKMPAERQESCKREYSEALWSWQTMLKPHMRTPDQPKQKIDVIYSEGKGRLAIFERSFRKTRFLETLVDRVAAQYAWPRPLVFEMKTCGDDEVGTNWRAARLTLCYELALEFAELYRDFGEDPKVFKFQINLKAKQ